MLLKLLISVFTLVTVVSSAGPEGFVNILKRVKLYEIPLVRNDSIIYKMDIEFKDAPAHFWSYTDSMHHAHIIEIYGSASNPLRYACPDNSPFQGVRVKNR